MSSKKQIMTVKDIKATVHEVPIDYSFMNLQAVSDILHEDPVSGKKIDKDQSQLANSNAIRRPVSLRLSNNTIGHLNDLTETLGQVFAAPKMLQWMDLSANEITCIKPGTFDRCPDISTLHLHANCISKFSDIDVIAGLKRLRSLSLHGNPVEEKKHYRNYVIHKIPTLIQLDFSPITKIDREGAEAWSLVYRKTLQARSNGQILCCK